MPKTCAEKIRESEVDPEWDKGTERRSVSVMLICPLLSTPLVLYAQSHKEQWLHSALGFRSISVSGRGGWKGWTGPGEAEVGRHCSALANTIDTAFRQFLSIDNKRGRGGRVEVIECKGWDSGMKNDPLCKHSKSTAKSYLLFSCQFVHHSLSLTGLWNVRPCEGRRWGLVCSVQTSIFHWPCRMQWSSILKSFALVWKVNIKTLSLCSGTLLFFNFSSFWLNLIQ